MSAGIGDSKSLVFQHAKGCGLVTSWMRCSAINIWTWPLSSCLTTWSSHTFWKRFLPNIYSGGSFRSEKVGQFSMKCSAHYCVLECSWFRKYCKNSYLGTFLLHRSTIALTNVEFGNRSPKKSFALALATTARSFQRPIRPSRTTTYHCFPVRNIGLHKRSLQAQLI